MATKLSVHNGLFLNQWLSDKSRLSRFVVTYNIRERRCTCPPTIKSYLTPYNRVFVVGSSILWLGSLLYLIIIKGYGTPGSLTLSRLFFQIIVLSLSLVSMWWLMCFCYYRYEVCEYLNDLLRHVESIQPDLDDDIPDTGLKAIKHLAKETFKLVTSPQHGDLLGVCVNFIILGIGVVPQVILLIALKLDTDPFALTLQYLIPRETRSFTLHLVIRLSTGVLCGTVAFEMCRTFRFSIGFMITGGVLIKTSLRHIMNTRRYEPTALKEYKTLATIQRKLCEPLSNFLQVTYEIGALLCVISFSASLIGWKFLPPSPYGIAVVITIGTGFIVQVALPLAVYAAEGSKGILLDWKKNVEKLQGPLRYNKRLLASLRPTGFMMAGQGMVEKGFRRRFLAKVLFNTQDLIVMLMQAKS